MVILNAARELKRKVLVNQTVPEIPKLDQLEDEIRIDEEPPATDATQLMIQLETDHLYPIDTEDMHTENQDIQIDVNNENFLSRSQTVFLAQSEEEEDHTEQHEQPIQEVIEEPEPLIISLPPRPKKRLAEKRRRPPNENPRPPHLIDKKPLSSDTCNICDAAFITPHHLAMHLRTKHQAPPLFKCQFCGDLFKDKEKFAAHELKHKYNYPCPHCSERFASKFGLASHLNTHVR